MTDVVSLLGRASREAPLETRSPAPVANEPLLAQEFLAGETLHGLAKRHLISRNLIRIWVAKSEVGGFDDDAVAADIVQALEDWRLNLIE